MGWKTAINAAPKNESAAHRQRQEDAEEQHFLRGDPRHSETTHDEQKDSLLP
jgi:hypothetical protein